MEDKKEISPVVKLGKARTKKVPLASKFAKMFLSEDAALTKEYVVNDIAIPKAKDLIASVLKSIIDTLFYGRGGGSSSSRTNSSYVSYRDYGSSGSSDRSERRSTSYKSPTMFSEIIFENPKDATDVIASMNEIIDRYKIATVGNMFDLAGITEGVPWTAESYGWTNFTSAKVIKTYDGYTIKTPPCMPID